MPRASITAITLAWLLWAAALFFQWVFAFVIAFSSNRAPAKPIQTDFDRQFALLFGGLAIGLILLLVAVRWFFLTCLIRQMPHPPVLRARSGSWTAALIASLGNFLIQALIAGLVFCGFSMWHEGYPRSTSFYFLAPAFLLLILHLPCFVFTRRITYPPPPALPS